MSNVSIFVSHQGCPQNCSFCNQKIISGQVLPVTKEDIEKTIEIALGSLKDNSKNSEIAFFGGSFTAIEPEYMESLLQATVPYINEFKGIRISTRPDAIDEKVLAVLKKYSVTSIELGAQSMCDRVLEMNNRGHTSADVVKASELIKSNGFELGLQMMTGLYGDNDMECIESARKLALLKPATIRIYPTVVLKGTELEKLYKEGKYTPQTLTQAVELCVKLMEIFDRAEIKIIRLGLHASLDIEKNYIAGAYHQAFRELCGALIYYNKINELLNGCRKGEYTLQVDSKYISQAIGQNKSNILKLKDHGFNIHFELIKDLGKYTVRKV